MESRTILTVRFCIKGEINRPSFIHRASGNFAPKVKARLRLILIEVTCSILLCHAAVVSKAALREGREVAQFRRTSSAIFRHSRHLAIIINLPDCASHRWHLLCSKYWWLARLRSTLPKLTALRRTRRFKNASSKTLRSHGVYILAFISFTNAVSRRTTTS